MTAAEHRERAEALLKQAWDGGKAVDVHNAVVALAQVHATLALAPAPPVSTQPQTRWNLDTEHEFIDAQATSLLVWPAHDKSGVLLGSETGPTWLFQGAANLRTLASLLTAHADRLESKP